MEKYIEMLTSAGAEVYAILGFIFLSAGWYVFRAITKSRRRVKEPTLDRVPKEETEESSETKGEEKEKVGSILGTGEHKCMCYKKGNIIDFTTIPEPLGEVYQFEPSCPISGAGYIVKENEDGKVVDYDPREVEVHIERSPEYAWFASHWDIVRVVFSVPVQWWKSASTYFAVGMLVVVFVCGLVVFD